MQQYQLPQQIQGQTAVPTAGLAGQPTGAVLGAGGMVMAGGIVLPEETEVITRKKLQDLVGQISQGEVLDPEVEEVIEIH